MRAWYSSALGLHREIDEETYGVIVDFDGFKYIHFSLKIAKDLNIENCKYNTTDEAMSEIDKILERYIRVRAFK